MQLIDETAFEQRVFVDSFGQGEFLPLPEVPSIQVLAGTGRDLKVIAASDWDVGKPGWSTFGSTTDSAIRRRVIAGT